MRHVSRYLAGSAVVGLLAPLAQAHHGFGTFVMDEDVEISGTVTGLDFVNPHSWLYLDVTLDDGTVAAYRCEMRSANTLRRSGWSPDLFPVGEQVRITGSPDRDDPYSCYVSTVIFDDGSSIDRYGQISAPAEIGQGERPLRLADGTPNLSGDWAREQRVMTDPRGQLGTLVPLSQADEFADDPEAAGVIGGARGTEQAAARAEAFRAAQQGLVEDAAAAEAAARAAAGGGRGFGGFGLGGGNTLTEAGQAAFEQMQTSDRCVFTNVVPEWSGDSAEVVNRIVQRGDTITIQLGRNGVERTIHMDMDSHPADLAPSLAGHSIGRWEGDVLVVDTVGFMPGLFNTRLPHSDQLHVVERISFNPESQEIELSYTANDPLYWTGEQTGESSTGMSETPYFYEPCTDLTNDEDVQLGPRA
ncbi:MAG: DUF6152 family protein [Gammaproteobacteria bacterium]|nr:DUF6152 family protein [Gammaproteobacteria bacterium]